TATPTPEFFTLSLHDALPISFLSEHDRAGFLPIKMVVKRPSVHARPYQGIAESGELLENFGNRPMFHARQPQRRTHPAAKRLRRDRKSTRLNSSHVKSRMPSS